MEVKRNEEEIVDRMMECGEILRVLRNKLKRLSDSLDVVKKIMEIERNVDDNMQEEE